MAARRYIRSSDGILGPKKTPQATQAFLEKLRTGGTIFAACQAAGIARPTAFAWRERDPLFKAAWDDAREDGTDLIEAEAQRRAVEGVARPVFQGGVQVGTVQEYSDTLMMLFLKGRRRQVFGEKVQTEVSGVDGEPIEVIRRIIVDPKND